MLLIPVRNVIGITVGNPGGATIVLVKITIQYFEGCPHWKLADNRVRSVLRELSRPDVMLDYHLVGTQEEAEQVAFRGSPTILIDGRDPFATGYEPIGMSCRVYPTQEGAQGAPSEAQLRVLLARNLPT